ncbi:calcyclin-binding protein-like [Physella acuta]|uniref:calcyclin-binding protein-like n=1 Tax=Physella acuta TaxID=109671 RepID=UPI0027DCC4DD|nr:calcyclin-binding protein-like [Physella acuta]
MSTDLDELKQDIAEYELLHKSAKRPKVQENLLKEIDRLKRDILTLEAKAALAIKGIEEKTCTAEHSAGYEENITNYAWDQSDKFMKLYLTLGGLDSITEQNVQTSFTNKSVTVKVRFQNKISTLHIAKLCEEIVPKDCYCKKKSDYVLVMLKKSEPGKTWPWVTEREKKIKEKNKPKFDDTEDPSVGITKLLKNMYDEGDDEMKRTISKAYYESQMKQNKEPFGDL